MLAVPYEHCIVPVLRRNISPTTCLFNHFPFQFPTHPKSPSKIPFKISQKSPSFALHETHDHIVDIAMTMVKSLYHYVTITLYQSTSIYQSISIYINLYQTLYRTLYITLHITLYHYLTFPL